MIAKRFYTKKAETDGVGKCGERVKEGFGHTVAYLELHGYCEGESQAPAADDGEVVSETTGMAGPAAHGAVRRGRKAKP